MLQAAVSGSLTEPAQVIRDTDLSPGQPLQTSQSCSSLGVIGRRSVSDLGAIGDNLSGSTNSGGMHDQIYNLQMLEAAYFKIPQPKDSERPRSYTPVWGFPRVFSCSFSFFQKKVFRQQFYRCQVIVICLYNTEAPCSHAC